MKTADIKNIVRIIKHIERQRNGVRNKAVFLILLCFGMERRRICELRWSDIGDNCQTIKIRNGNNSRFMVMPEILRNSIRELMAFWKALRILTERTGFTIIFLPLISENGYSGLCF